MLENIHFNYLSNTSDRHFALLFFRLVFAGLFYLSQSIFGKVAHQQRVFDKHPIEYLKIESNVNLIVSSSARFLIVLLLFEFYLCNYCPDLAYNPIWRATSCKIAVQDSVAH